MDSASSQQLDEMFRPPIHRVAVAALDRALFSKSVTVTAARIVELKNVSRLRSQLEKSKDLLRLERVSLVRDDPDEEAARRGGKCLLLAPEVKCDDPTTWSPVLQQAVEAKEVGVIPYDLKLDYKYWTYLEIMKAILPEESQEEIPVGFNQVGHVAHLNLRKQYLPYQKLIAEVLMDKNPSVRTVINKIDDVGEVSEYRTFKYEVLAGEPDMNVEVREEECIFRFDYSKVYWNSKLHTEHKRLVSMFKPGEVVCDVMAGVGPFAIPAGKKGVFVWANDLNPESFACLKDAIVRNKVTPFVRPFCTNGHTFIPQAATSLLHLTNISQNTITIPVLPRPRNQPPRTQTLTLPPTIAHFIMNLPASALTFLPSFRGIYAGHAQLFAPHTPTPLPMIHVHCFSAKREDGREADEVVRCVNDVLGLRGEEMLRVGDPNVEGEVGVWDVRNVAPLKTMFCASFRAPRSVVFAEEGEGEVGVKGAQESVGAA